jgi:hypothetical protein
LATQLCVQVKGLQTEYERVTSATKDEGGDVGASHSAATAAPGELAALKKRVETLQAEKSALAVGVHVPAIGGLQELVNKNCGHA